MYRLLLVDDEPTVRKGMSSRIDWKKHGVEVVGLAANGAVALALAMELRPHIILTDIRMPVMDGIELSHHIREKLPGCKIIIMSGYDEFAYAKSLMNMKVTEYLLKPIVEHELMEVIAKLVHEIKEDEVRESNRQVTSRLLNENLLQLKSRLMHKILERAFSDIGEIAKQAAVLNLPVSLRGGELMIIVLAMDNPNAADRTDEREMELTQFSIANIAEELINQAASGFVCCGGFNHFIGLICVDPESGPDIDTLMQSIQYLIKKHLGITVHIGAGTAVRDIADIGGSYKEALSTLNGKMFKGKRNFVQIALRYMEDRYNTDISLAEVASIAYVTPNYLSKIFKEEMDMGFSDWLNNLRVGKAKELLLHTNLKTYEIAEKVGYKDYKYFSGMFKKTVGLSPKEYRQQAAP